MKRGRRKKDPVHDGILLFPTARRIALRLLFRSICVPAHHLPCAPAYVLSHMFIHAPMPLRFLLFDFCQRCLILAEDHLLDLVPRTRIDRMCDVPVFPIRRLTARHCNEKALLSLDHLNVMHYKLVIQRNGNNRFHLAFLCNFSNPNICYLHSNYAPLVGIFRQYTLPQNVFAVR